MRLATIEKILKLTPIPGADAIESADVLGWKVVVKKGEFQEGDLAVFHQPDTVVDEANPVYSFLKDKRLRVVRLRGQVSQGLVLPLAAFNLQGQGEGADVTEIVALKKYEKPINPQLAGVVKGNFPSFLRKTDELNARTYKGVVEEIAGKDAYIALKMDGSSLTAYHNNGSFGVCSRNLDLKDEGANAFWTMAKKYNLETHLKNKGNYALQAELVGPGVNGNKLGLKEPDLSIFNLFNIDTQEYVSYEELKDFCFSNNLPMVPVLYEGVFDFNLDNLLNMANNLKYGNGSPAEGIVCRPKQETYSHALRGRMSFKVISETFCLKHKE